MASLIDSTFAAASRAAKALRIPQDKVMHIALGVVWLSITMMGSWVLRDFGLGAFLAYGTTVYAAMYEFNQWIRKEGKPEFWDAFCTALPGWAAWVILEGWRAMQ